MKSYGKVMEYDGYVGTIIGLDGNSYMVLDTDLVDKDIKKDDYVSFDKDLYKDIELTRYIARFVKRVNKEDIKN